MLNSPQSINSLFLRKGSDWDIMEALSVRSMPYQAASHPDNNFHLFIHQIDHIMNMEQYRNISPDTTPCHVMSCCNSVEPVVNSHFAQQPSHIFQPEYLYVRHNLPVLSMIL